MELNSLATESSSISLATSLKAFTQSDVYSESEYATFVALFRHPRGVTEEEFERLLWLQLQQLHDLEASPKKWDPSVASDPSDPCFSFSYANRALYVVGLHANSSRIARRFPWPTLIFNPHQQFEQLRRDGKWRKMQAEIRKRDVALQGNVNPMLSDFGEKSEARQYSGRAVDEHWQAPFHAVSPKKNKESIARCPFAHQ